MTDTRPLRARSSLIGLTEARHWRAKIGKGCFLRFLTVPDALRLVRGPHSRGVGAFRDVAGPSKQQGDRSVIDIE